MVVLLWTPSKAQQFPLGGLELSTPFPCLSPALFFRTRWNAPLPYLRFTQNSSEMPVPIVVEFERILGAPALMVGFALPGANMHAPDEWFPVDNFDKGIGALIRLYKELGKKK